MTVEEYRHRVKREKRAAALRAAIEEFLQHGYDRTTLIEVAKRAGISTGTLFKHFPTKAALFAAIMEHLWDASPALDRPLPASGDPRRGLVRLGLDYAALLRQRKTEPLFRVIIAAAQRFPELGQELFERGRAPFLERLHDYLRSEVDAGTLAVPDVDLAARQFFGMINDIIFWPRFLVTDLVVTPREVDRVVREAATTFLARYALQAKSRPAVRRRRQRGAGGSRRA